MSRCSGVTVLLLIFIHFYQKTSVWLSDRDTTTAQFLNCLLASFLISFKLSYFKIIRRSTCFRVVGGQRGQEDCLQVEILKLSHERFGVCLLNCRYSFYSNFRIIICCWIFLQTRFMAHCHTPSAIVYEQISHSYLFIFHHAAL